MDTLSDKARLQLIDTIRASIVGDAEAVEGPFGLRTFTYADYTASGRSLSFIEDYIHDEVLSKYANTHTEISGTGLQTTRFREQARDIVRDAVGATEDDAVIFCGSGATGAVNKLITILGLRLPCALNHRYSLANHIPVEERPVVFIGPYEHHSNELPWKETICDVEVINEDSDGGIDCDMLVEKLQQYSHRPVKIGSFSAASNVTGITSDVKGISNLLHAHGALAFWDYAAAGPYLEIQMNSEDGYSDALFLSPHKFIGGPGTPGILVVKRALCTNPVPSEPGGGTVLWVNPTEHAYLEDVEEREEGGTPDIIGSIRAGLVFQLKQAVGVEFIRQRENSFVRRCIATWGENPNIVILGNHERDRISIVSFLIRHRQRYLHWGFTATLLNDLFGIQSRGGCSCAGPYGHYLLGIEPMPSEAMSVLIHQGYEAIRPGWVRLNFNYFITERVFDFLLRAVDFVATHGWKLLPLYRLDVETGRWQHRDGYPEPPMRLREISYARGHMEYASHHAQVPDSVLPGYFVEAERILAAWLDRVDQESLVDPCLDSEFERWRWFPLPCEVLSELRHEEASTECCRAFEPRDV